MTFNTSIAEIRAPLQDGGEFIAHLVAPGEARPLVESAGFQVRTIPGLEGLTTLIDERLSALQGEAWEAWVNLNYQLAAEPTLLGASDHPLCVAQK